MARLSFSSLRVRLLLLVLLAIIPALGLILYTGLEQRRQAAVHAQKDALRVLDHSVMQQDLLIAGARQLLVALVSLPEVRHRDSGGCNALFFDILGRYPFYANLGAIAPNGDIFCSARSLGGPINVAERAYFRRAMATRDFAIGDYQVGRVTGKATINFGYPLVSDAGEVKAVVFAALDLAWLNKLAAEAQLPQGSTFTVIDSNGTILARYPEPEKWVGQSIPEAPIFKAIQAQQWQGTAEAPGLDGIPRLYVFTPTHGLGGSGIAYAVGIPIAAVFGEANRILARNLALLGLVTLLALGAAWFGGDLFILRRVNALVGATKRLAGGDLSARTGLPYGEGELTQLARAFDEMAESLQRLTTEQARLYESATQQAKRWEALFRLGQLLSRSLELDEVYPAFAEAVKANLPYDRIGVVVQEGERLVMALSVAEPPLPSWQGASWPQTEGTAVGWVLDYKQPRLVRDLRTEQTFSDEGFIAREGVRSTLMLPLLAGGKAVGVFFVDSRTPGTYTEQDLELLDPLAQQLALAIQDARLFREIQEKGRQLESASKHKSQFLANMSHELRTPLNAILGYTELILDNIYGEVPGKIRDILERLGKSGRYLLGLINDVLDLSKIEAGQLTLSLTDYSMKEVVQTVIAAVESLAAEKSLALKFTLPPDLPLGKGDERRLTQVLLNLVGNAIKFTAVGEVRVEVRASDGAFLVSVADTGPGIAPADQQKIFEEFQQVDSSSTRQKGGTGLGLAIAKKIIELHAGHIGVESSLGKGSTFWFSVPIRVERRPEAT